MPGIASLTRLRDRLLAAREAEQAQVARAADDRLRPYRLREGMRHGVGDRDIYPERW